MIKVYASLLAADALAIGADAQRILDAGADGLHLDIMDAHFVPNLSYGPALCKAIKKRFPNAFLDVHLMMERPLAYIEAFADASAITVHAEAEAFVETLAEIKRAGCLCGASVRPGTDVAALAPVLDRLDQTLIMTVEPGFGGQKLIPSAVEKAAVLRKAGFAGDIAADGGVNASTAPLLIEKGVNVLVMGTALFSERSPERMMHACRVMATSK